MSWNYYKHLIKKTASSWCCCTSSVCDRFHTRCTAAKWRSWWKGNMHGKLSLEPRITEFFDSYKPAALLMNSDLIAREGTAMWMKHSVSNVRTITEPLWGSTWQRLVLEGWRSAPKAGSLLSAALRQPNAETLGLHPWGAGKTHNLRQV